VSNPCRRGQEENNLLETNVVTGHTGLQLFVVHLDRLDFGGHVSGGEGDNHTSLDGTGFNTTDRYRTDTTNLVDILERKSEGLIGRTNWRLNGINGVEESLSLGDTSLGLIYGGWNTVS
jgi:hypothetical protein